MWWRWSIVVTALGGLCPPGAAAQSSRDSAATLGVSVSRFYRAGAGKTLFEIFARVPFVALDPLPGGETSGAAYRVAFTVRDSSGLQLLDQSWTQQVPRRLLSVAGGSTVEHVSFAAAPGRYGLEVVVTDSATGRAVRNTTAISAFTAGPVASDLLLITGMRAAAGADTVPRGGEIRKGSTLLQASGATVLTPRQAQLGYYLEFYAAKAETVSLVVRVRRPDGGQVVAVPARSVTLPVGGGLQQEMLDLAGLPPGRYALEIQAAGADSSITRAAEFGMTGFETERAAAGVASGPPPSRFDAMSEAQLDSAYDPLIYLMRSDEQGIFSGLTVEGKRGYLRQFWAKRDPTPGTAANQELDAFYRRIDEATRRFREGGASETPGWRTDRGRIFIKYGEPDDRLQRPQAGSTAPYEVWKYTRTRELMFVFLDQTRFGNYSLIYTNDRREVSRPDWADLLGPEAVKDVQRF
jgi:GWxTD domain-containing protein